MKGFSRKPLLHCFTDIGVDIESATKAGIKVARLPGDKSGNALSCAEHAIYLILSLLRNQVDTQFVLKTWVVNPWVVYYFTRHKIV